MAMNPILSSGLNGIQQGLRGIEGAAQEIAEFNTAGAGESEAQATSAPATSDVTSAIVDLKVYERQVQASAEVVQTADELMGFLLGEPAR